MDWKIELVAIPVTDVDRAKAFYVDQVGFHADHDHQVNEALRFVQLTPPGSACSIVMGTGITEMAPGSQKGIQIVVADVEAARQQLIAHSVQASDVDVQPWGSFVTFSDPDGNTWALQQLPAWREELRIATALATAPPVLHSRHFAPNTRALRRFESRYVGRRIQLDRRPRGHVRPSAGDGEQDQGSAYLPADILI